MPQLSIETIRAIYDFTARMTHLGLFCARPREGESDCLTTWAGKECLIAYGIERLLFEDLKEELGQEAINKMSQDACKQVERENWVSCGATEEEFEKIYAGDMELPDLIDERNRQRAST